MYHTIRSTTYLQEEDDTPETVRYGRRWGFTRGRSVTRPKLRYVVLKEDKLTVRVR